MHIYVCNTGRQGFHGGTINIGRGGLSTGNPPRSAVISTYDVISKRDLLVVVQPYPDDTTTESDNNHVDRESTFGKGTRRRNAD